MSSWIFRAYADALDVATFQMRPAVRPAPSRPSPPEPPGFWLRPRPTGPSDRQPDRDAAARRRAA